MTMYYEPMDAKILEERLAKLAAQEGKPAESKEESDRIWALLVQAAKN